ncbi:MAG: bifunctional diguanylate cyclase/phosphodiesterase [Lachnospiraceae bacterium]|nr:bifunctional diguanylate cyclase/phosphodiesterase [Lachnospiraceae bacterium]
MNILCSEGFLHFFNAMQIETVSLDDILNLTPDALNNIADEFHLGKFEIKIEFSGPIRDLKDYNITRILYESNDGHEHFAHTRCIKNQEKGNIYYVVFPVKGYNYTVDDKTKLDFIIKYINLIITRSITNELLNRRQFTDYMTQLPNTAYFMKFSNDLGIRGILNKYTLIFSNLKGFNYINQQMGSQAGDSVLKEYSKKLKNFYSSDEIIARFGGDNFVALLKNERVEEYINYISNINISIVNDNKTKTLSISARSGIYPLPALSGNVGEAINRANASLIYAKKIADSDCEWFTDSILERINKDREVVSGFRTALIHKEFLVYYQPKVNVITKKIAGCEALVRWKHNGKILPPGMFVPILEEEGLICDLDFFVLEKVCEDIRNWLRNGITPPRISVNFSKHHLKNQDLINDVISILTKYRINPDYLEIELTESATSDDFKAMTQFVDDLNDHGIRTSIDDFGTGYSSLSLIKDLHVNVIKIDKSFVDNIATEDSKDKIILGSILTMITGLGMNVIAEGCETVEQARILKEMNCNMIQGYLFDKPLPQDEYTEKLASAYIYPIDI